MAYGSTPYVGMTPPKNGGHIKSAQMTRSKCLHRSVNGLHEPYQALSSTSSSSSSSSSSLGEPGNEAMQLQFILLP